MKYVGIWRWRQPVQERRGLLWGGRAPVFSRSVPAQEPLLPDHVSCSVSKLSCRPSCVCSSAPPYPPNAPELCELFLLHHLHSEVLRGLHELLLLQHKAQGGLGGPGQQLGTCHVFPQKVNTWESRAELDGDSGNAAPLKHATPTRGQFLGLECLGGRRK